MNIFATKYGLFFKVKNKLFVVIDNEALKRKRISRCFPEEAFMIQIKASSLTVQKVIKIVSTKYRIAYLTSNGDVFVSSFHPERQKAIEDPVSIKRIGNKKFLDVAVFDDFLAFSTETDICYYYGNKHNIKKSEVLRKQRFLYRNSFSTSEMYLFADFPHVYKRILLKTGGKMIYPIPIKDTFLISSSDRSIICQCSRKYKKLKIGDKQLSIYCHLCGRSYDRAYKKEIKDVKFTKKYFLVLFKDGTVFFEGKFLKIAEVRYRKMWIKSPDNQKVAEIEVARNCFYILTEAGWIYKYTRLYRFKKMNDHQTRIPVSEFNNNLWNCNQLQNVKIECLNK